MTPGRPISVSVGRLVVHGADRPTAERIAAAIRTELARLMAGSSPDFHAWRRERVTVPLGSGPAGPADIGRAAAAGIGRAIAGPPVGDPGGRR